MNEILLIYIEIAIYPTRVTQKFEKNFKNFKILILLALGFPQTVLEFKKELF